MKEQNIDKIVYSDSDNAFLMDIQSLTYLNAKIFNNVNHIVPNVFFTNFDYLNRICNFYFTLYECNFKEKIIPYSDFHNGIFLYSDMYFLHQAIEALQLEFETLKLTDNNIIFNTCIENYELEINHKVLKKGTNFQLVNIHFAGINKTKTLDILNKLKCHFNSDLY